MNRRTGLPAPRQVGRAEPDNYGSGESENVDLGHVPRVQTLEVRRSLPGSSSFDSIAGSTSEAMGASPPPGGSQHARLTSSVICLHQHRRVERLVQGAQIDGTIDRNGSVSTGRSAQSVRLNLTVKLSGMEPVVPNSQRSANS